MNDLNFDKIYNKLNETISKAVYYGSFGHLFLCRSIIPEK
jgi:hypothetical protein